MRNNRLWTFALLATALLALFLPQLQVRAVHAAQDPTSQVPPKTFSTTNYDIREDETAVAEYSKIQTLRNSQPDLIALRTRLSQSMRSARENLAREIPELYVRPGRGDSVEIVGVQPGSNRFLTPASARDHEVIARNFVRRNAALYGLTTAQATGLEKIVAYTNPAGNLSWVELRQEVNGIPVFQGELRAAFTNKGELVQTVSNLAPIFEANTGAVTAQGVSQTLAAD